jgi:adenine-specific DNA-methyltransferase
MDPDLQLTLVELDPLVLQVAKRVITANATEFVNQDFLSFDEKRMYDGIIANPPYLRHHDFSYSDDIFEVIGKRSSVKLSKLTNLYGLFLLEVCRRLNPGGRAAVIIPTEWTNANFGTAIKHQLLKANVLHTLIYFSHESLPFADALTTASVLLLEKPVGLGQDRPNVRTIYVKGELAEAKLIGLCGGLTTTDDEVLVKDISYSELLSSKKWDYLIKTEEISAKRTVTHLRDLAITKRGIATGANEFFHLSLSEAESNKLDDEALKTCVGRASDVHGLCFTDADFDRLISENRRTHLVCINREPSEGAIAYIRKGEQLKLHERYLLAARRPWYQMESRPYAPIWAAVFGRSGLKFVRNKARVLNLTTFHCVYPSRTDDVFLDALTVTLNSRMVQLESAREQRVYGGGLLKAEPKDLLDMWVPPLKRFDQVDLESLAAYLPLIDLEFRASGEISDSNLKAIDLLIERGLRSSDIPQNYPQESLSFDL